MNRIPTAFLAAALMSSAAAQNTPMSLEAQKLPSPVRHAGVFHVASGTWTRTGGASASFGPDIIYSNTAPSGYFSSAGGLGGFGTGATNYDEGIIPSTSNTSNPGDRDEYCVNGLEIGYCDTSAPGTSGWRLGFYNSYARCSGPAAPDFLVDATGLPAAGGCWNVTIDLSGGFELTLAGDGGDGFDNVLDLDTFAWSFEYAGTGTGEAGFLLCGNPAATDPNYVAGGDPVDGTNTYFGPPSLCSPDAATGLFTQDSWFLHQGPPPMMSGCYWFGGYRNVNGCTPPISNPYASWSMEILASAAGTCGFPHTEYCTSNPTSQGFNSTILPTGSPSVSDDDVTLTASLPPNTLGFFITSPTQGFVANPGNSAGNLCLAGSIGRFQQLAGNSGAAGTISISTVTGQWSLAAIPMVQGSYAAMAGQTSNFQCWHRDTSASGPTSNFSNAIAIVWEP